MSKPAKKKARRTTTATATTGPRTKPRVLVLESAGGSATSAVRRSGAMPVRVNPRDIAAVDEALTAGFDGLLLTGGGDLDPRLYGEKPHKHVYGVSETRDYTEWEALDRAEELGVPVMGICRGMQLIAVHNGGALKQHVPGHRGGSHIVFGESGSRFNRVTGRGDFAFPSLHHQIVKRHGGRGMKVAARSSEGYIEAIESKRVLAVQFHPEYDYNRNEASRRLFDWLAAAAARKAGLPEPTRMPYIEPVRNWDFGSQLPLRPRATSHRPAGTRRKPVTSRWLCRECGMEFDERRDRDDHEVWVCTAPHARNEPPPGHPDWDDVLHASDKVTIRVKR